MAKRPITFTFNGGPGAASLWLHMGLLGPERIGVNPEGMLEDIQVGHNPNPYSILDLTDLVFIDPVGTGYSRVSEGTDPNAFYSYAMDIASVGEFIRLYTTRNGRWGSPKYLAGESYGTTRAVGVANYLSNACGLGLNGLMLVSTANDFSTLMSAFFATGLFEVDEYQDEINFGTGIATSRVLRTSYSAENLASAIESGMPYEYDENYIYVARDVPLTYIFTIDAEYSSDDHGLERFSGTTLAVECNTIYGVNLKNKLERDVLTISQQTLTSSEKQQVQENLGLADTASNSDIGIVVNGNKTGVGITAAIGQYVILKNSTITGKDDGLYTAAKAIPANTVIDGTYLSTAVSGGGLNALSDQIPDIKTVTQTGTTDTNGNLRVTQVNRAKVLLAARLTTDLSASYTAVCVQITTYYLSSNQYWGIRLVDHTGSPVASKAVSVDLTYIN